MKEKITAIVLGSIRHSDRYNVTNVYTRERGRMALLTPAGSGKSSRQTASRLQPLSAIEAQVSISATRELNVPSGIAYARIWRSIYCEPVKSTTAIFLSEFLSHLLRDAPSEPHMWDFMLNSLEYYDSATDKKAIANFHITFLLGIMRLTGIFPDISGYTDGMEFDMQSGTMALPFHFTSTGKARVDAAKTALIPKLARMNYSNSRHFHFSGKERSELLDGILKYFGCHFPGCDNLKSLDILKEIFS